MFVALNRFTIRNGMAQQVRQTFAERPRLVDPACGFMGMQVMSPLDNEAEFWLVTRRSDEPSYRSWHNGHDHHALHSGIPKGLKLVPGSAEIRFFALSSLRLFAE